VAIEHQLAVLDISQDGPHDRGVKGRHAQYLRWMVGFQDGVNVLASNPSQCEVCYGCHPVTAVERNLHFCDTRQSLYHTTRNLSIQSASVEIYKRWNKPKFKHFRFVPEYRHAYRREDSHRSFLPCLQVLCSQVHRGSHPVPSDSKRTY